MITKQIIIYKQSPKYNSDNSLRLFLYIVLADMSKDNQMFVLRAEELAGIFDSNHI